MKTEQIQKVLENETGVRSVDSGGDSAAGGPLAAKTSSHTYLVGDELELTVHLAIGSEAIAINRVRRVILSPELLVFETHKNERVYIGSEPGVRALKFAPSDAGKKAGTGFAALR